MPATHLQQSGRTPKPGQIRLRYRIVRGMKRRYVITILGSLLAGFALTFLFTAQMSWNIVGDCSDTSVPLPQTVRTVECTGMTYGFPLRFIASEPSLSLNLTNGSGLQTSVSASATTDLDIVKMLTNILFWAIFSGAIVTAIMYKLGTKKKAPATPVESKEEK